MPPGDPIYSQLATLSRGEDKVRSATAAKGSAALTRFEAALSTARAYLQLVEAEKMGRPSPYSRESLKAMRDLAGQLKPELIQLEVPAEAIATLAEKFIRRAFAAPPATPGESSPSRAGGLNLGPALGAAQPAGVGRAANRSASGLTGLGQAVVNSGALSGRTTSATIEVPLSQRLRVGTALLAMQRETDDLFGDAPARRRLATSGSLGLAYDYNEAVTIRAGGSFLEKGVEPMSASSALAAPLFQGATRASGAGGGLDLSLGNVRLSTNVESLGLSDGTRGTRLGGGIGLSAWQNRLTLQANLSRLVPEDSAALASTATEMNIGVDVTRQLSLNLLYQGLFTEQKFNNRSRVAGGLTLNF